MVAYNSVEEGARLLIRRNLGMWRGQDVVIIVDEETYQVGLELEKAALREEVRPTLIHISRQQQSNHSQHTPLNTPLSRAIAAAQGLATAVSDMTDGTGFRVAVLREGQSSQLKIAHMPGITIEMIASLTETDYEVLEKGSEALRKPLLLGQDVTIITHDHQGFKHELHLKLGGWDYPPVLSSGIVQNNSFDNVPSGEVYVPPLKGTASGSVVINGSVTGYVFGKQEAIIVHFAGGALIDIEPHDHPAAVILRNQIKRAREFGDAEPHFLCELGIGVNTAVTELTGGTLMDEKAYGTAHIAIGTNDEFGGTVRAANIHEDLVFFRPTIRIDNRDIVRDGEIVVVESEWRPDYQAVANPSPFDKADVLVDWTGTQADSSMSGLLERHYIDGTGVKRRITVGSDETARLAANVYQAIPQDDQISIQELGESVHLTLDQLQKVLYIMGEVYKLVQIA
jgi:leucyl aminopeptidase (aminopeptidase T)